MWKACLLNRNIKSKQKLFSVSQRQRKGSCWFIWEEDVWSPSRSRAGLQQFLSTGRVCGITGPHGWGGRGATSWVKEIDDRKHWSKEPTKDGNVEQRRHGDHCRRCPLSLSAPKVPPTQHFMSSASWATRIPKSEGVGFPVSKTKSDPMKTWE